MTPLIGLTPRARVHGFAVIVWCLIASGGIARAQTLETLVQFSCETNGCAPNTGLIQGPDLFFYGAASEGGPGEQALPFKMDRNGALTVLPGPVATVLATDGFFYGVADGDSDHPAGTVFRKDIHGQVAVVHAFDGVTTRAGGPLLQAGNGWLYGLAAVPETDRLRLFRVSTSGAFTLLRTLPATVTGARTLIQGPNKALFGTTYGGCGGGGCVFRTQLNGQTHVLAGLTSNPDAGSFSAYADLMLASDGSFYGTTIGGGSHGRGSIFRMTKNGRTTIVHSFDGSDGQNPYSAPIEGEDGYLYGTTGFGGPYDAGTIYRLDRASGMLTVLHAFGETELSGRSPVAPVTQGDDGALYGVTVRGGINDHGTAFRLTLPAAASDMF